MRATEFIKLSADTTNEIFDKIDIKGVDREIATIMQAVITAEITAKLVKKGVIVRDED